MASSKCLVWSFGSCWLLRAAPKGVALCARLDLEGAFWPCLLRAAPGQAAPRV
ncbi:hypothetical protein A2U01_0100190, partial [Trifolium medium]|nr:hypothetical protein [Trifolium medium]